MGQDKMEVLPGLDAKIEFFTPNHRDLLMIHESRIIPFSKWSNRIIDSLMDLMNSDPKACKCLSSIQDPLQRLKQFIICRYGALNHRADLDSSFNALDHEYYDCGFRGNCPFKGEGIICRELLVNDQILSRAEVRVLKLIAQDFTDVQIAMHINRSFHTVRETKRKLTVKTGLYKPGLAKLAAEHNLI